MGRWRARTLHWSETMFLFYLPGTGLRWACKELPSLFTDAICHCSLDFLHQDHLSKQFIITDLSQKLSFHSLHCATTSRLNCQHMQNRGVSVVSALVMVGVLVALIVKGMWSRSCKARGVSITSGLGVMMTSTGCECGSSTHAHISFGNILLLTVKYLPSWNTILYVG